MKPKVQASLLAFSVVVTLALGGVVLAATPSGTPIRLASGAMRPVEVEPVEQALERLASQGAEKQAYLDLAAAYREQMAPVAAAVVLEHAAELFSDPGIFRAAAEHSLAMGWVDRARSVVERGLAEHPSDAGLLETAAAVAVAGGDAGRATELLAKAWAAGADPLAWLAKPSFHDARGQEPLSSLVDVALLAASLPELTPTEQADRLGLLAELAAPDAAPAIVETLLATSEPSVVLAGLRALRQLGAGAEGPFADLLARGDASLRLATLRTIRESGLDAFTPLLERQLQDEREARSYDLAQLTLAEVASRRESLEGAAAILRGVPEQNGYRHLALASLAGLYRRAGRTEEAQRVAAEADVLRAAQAGAYLEDGSVLERYAECMNRTDVAEVRALLEQHKYVERVDARIYGLPENDFDDQKALTLAERLMLRELFAKRGEPLPTEGPIQYPREIFHFMRRYYAGTGLLPDCSRILEGYVGEDVLTLDWEKAANTDTSADNEVNVVVNPWNEQYIVATANPSSGTRNEVYRSSDRGATFTLDSVDQGSGTCDPVSYYNRIGTTDYVYHSFLSTCSSVCQVWVSYSTNNGSSWTGCAAVETGTTFDREDMAVDTNPWGSSSCANTVYVAYHNNNTQTVRASSGTSAPYCQSWKSAGTGLGSTIGSAVVVSTNGRAHDFYNQFTSGIKMMSTTDCGTTWGSSSSVASYNYANFDWGIPSTCERTVYHYVAGDNVRVLGSPFRNRIYLTWNDLSSNCSPPGCSGNTTCNDDVFVAVGTPNNPDNPTSWTWSSYNLTDPLTDSYTDEFYPHVTVDQSDGAVYLSYYRSGSGASSLTPRAEQVHYVVMRSVTGGDTASEWELLQVTASPSCETSGCGGNTWMQWGDYTWNDVVNGVAYPVWTDRRDDADEENWIGRVCTEPAHWSERGNSPSAPPVTLANPGGGLVNISWTAPDIATFVGTDTVWGDGGDGVASRKFQLYFDGALEQDNIPAGTTSISNFDPGDCNQHSYRIRAVNGCGVTKDYQLTNWTATGCCSGNPTTVDVTPNGPLTLCQGSGQLLTANAAGGTPPFTYQWYRDGGVIGGATSSTYSANQTGTHAYNCELKSSACTTGVQDGTATSITWQLAPTFSGLLSATDAQDATCTVDLTWNPASTACAGPLTYKVYRDVISGFTPGAGNLVASGVTCTGSPCTYADTNALVNGTTYYYVVRAVDGSNGAEDANLVERSATPTGVATTGTWSDTVDSYANIAAAVAAGYAHAADQGSDDWAVTAGFDHTSGTGKSFTSVDVATVTDKYLVTPAKTLSASSVMTFWHAYTFESGWDGAVLELSTDGGSTWPVDLGGSITAGGYTGTIGTGYSNPLAGRSAWTGTAASFAVVNVNLGSYAGANRKIRWRMGCDSSMAGGTWYIDDVQITNVETAGVCVTGGGCTDPNPAPAITGIADESACAQSGIRVTYTPSSDPDVDRHDLVRDGVVVVSGYTSTALYNPGDTASHSYKIRAVDSTCFTDSGTQAASDANGTPGAPSISGIADESACAQSGIRVSYSGGTGASSHNLVRDGVVVVTGYTSGALYNPGDTASHSYVVRAVSGSCTADSPAQAASDANGTPGAPSISGISDESACAQSGIRVSYSGGSGASSHNLVRDGVVVVTGYTSGALYNPGDTASHSYVVRAVSGACTADSPAQGFSDANGTPGTPSISGISDESACAQSGIRVSYSGGTGASSHNLVRDGVVVVTGYTSGALYNPGDTASHSYVVRAVSGTCTADSPAQAASDANGTPGAPSISGIADESACAQSGIRVSYSGGTGATSHNLVRDGVVVVTGYTSGALYNPGDTASHSYVVRAVAGSCTADSPAQAASDANGTPGAPSISGIADESACAQSGIRVSYSGGTGASSHNLVRDGVVVVTGYTSGALYNPGDTASHSYVVRAVSGACTADSPAQAASDANGTPGTPSISGIADESACAQSGIRVSYSGGTGASSHDLVQDGVVVVTGYTSGALYNPGDTASHSYVVRAVSGACTADSPAQGFSDGDATPTAPAAPVVGDVDACAQSGVQVSWGSVTGATGYDLWVDGAILVADVTSPYTFNPGDSSPHGYQVRAKNATCTGAWSGATAGTDIVGAPGATVVHVSDVNPCEPSSLSVAWDAAVGATGYDLRIDGGTVITDVTAPYAFVPGDLASHTFEVRAKNAACVAPWSAPASFADGGSLADAIFCDSFELNDTSGWIETVP